MTTNAINGSAINQTQFPGAETGLSLIELTGTVQVVCNLSGVTLRRAAQATTSPEADGTASTVKKSLLGAAIVCNATSTAVSRRKVSLALSSQQAICNATTTARINFRQTATTSGSASASTASGYNAVIRRAAVEPTAFAPPIAGKTCVFRGAGATGSALSAVATRRKVAATVESSATVSSSVTAKIRNRIGAQASAEAVSSSSTKVRITLGASSLARALGTVPAFTKEPTGAYTPCVATCSSITLISGISFGAAAQANASSSATIRLKYVLFASATATASAQSTAADYATAMPAPAERTMTVQGYDRRMEVTQ